VADRGPGVRDWRPEGVNWRRMLGREPAWAQLYGGVQRHASSSRVSAAWLALVSVRAPGRRHALSTKHRSASSRPAVSPSTHAPEPRSATKRCPGTAWRKLNMLPQPAPVRDPHTQKSSRRSRKGRPTERLVRRARRSAAERWEPRGATWRKVRVAMNARRFRRIPAPGSREHDRAHDARRPEGKGRPPRCEHDGTLASAKHWHETKRQHMPGNASNASLIVIASDPSSRHEASQHTHQRPTDTRKHGGQLRSQRRCEPLPSARLRTSRPNSSAEPVLPTKAARAMSSNLWPAPVRCPDWHQDEQQLPTNRRPTSAAQKVWDDSAHASLRRVTRGSTGIEKIRDQVHRDVDELQWNNKQPAKQGNPRARIESTMRTPQTRQRDTVSITAAPRASARGSARRESVSWQTRRAIRGDREHLAPAHPWHVHA